MNEKTTEAVPIPVVESETTIELEDYETKSDRLAKALSDVLENPGSMTKRQKAADLLVELGHHPEALEEVDEDDGE